jgi:hypothetical protein
MAVAQTYIYQQMEKFSEIVCWIAVGALGLFAVTVVLIRATGILGAILFFLFRV